MRDYVIITDADSEMPLHYADEYGIPVFEMPFMLDGEEYLYDLGRTVNIPDFFEKLKNGSTVTTSCRPPWEVKDFFKKYIEEGKDILYIGLSNKMSQHLENCQMAAQELMDEYKDAKIIIIDTLTISIGEALMSIEAAKLRRAGKTIEETAQIIEDKKLSYAAFFIVDDLNHLKRGGRLSPTAAFFGTMLDLKPVLHVSDDGRLEPLEKIKGRKKALRRLAEIITERGINLSEQTVIIAYSSMEDGETLKKMLLEISDAKDVELWKIGPVIGGHTGPCVTGIGCICTKR